jgi:starvation-inducible DNA-binding protein
METVLTKAHVQLGFSKPEADDLVQKLNGLLSDYHLHYQKLRKFHWDVVGPDFFDLHSNFEKEYKVAYESIDMIAERIRIFDKKPVGNFSQYIALAVIKEVERELSPAAMVKELLKDYELLLSNLTTTIELAKEIGDFGTEDMLMTFMREMEKKHWMYNAWLKKV